MDFLPLFHRTNGKRCLIVGGGVIASRRAKVMAATGLSIDVIAPDIMPSLLTLVKTSGGEVMHQEFNVKDIERDDIWQQYFLIIAATSVRKVNAEICNFANAHNVLVNVIDAYQDSDFIFPSLVTRDSITIAISNSGYSPVLSRLLKEKIDMYLPERYGQLSSFVGKYRDKVKKALPDIKIRVRFWEDVLQGSIAEHVFSDREDAANNAFLKSLEKAQKSIKTSEVYLINVGPGDPELLTLRAFRLLQQSEIVLYDEFLSSEILALIKPDVKRVFIDVGVEDYMDLSIQQLICHLKPGKRVARLFAEHSSLSNHKNEYVDALTNNDISFQDVPGVSKM